jgi:hypothetical protein
MDIQENQKTFGVWDILHKTLAFGLKYWWELVVLGSITTIASYGVLFLAHALISSQFLGKLCSQEVIGCVTTYTLPFIVSTILTSLTIWPTAFLSMWYLYQKEEEYIFDAIKRAISSLPDIFYSLVVCMIMV